MSEALTAPDPISQATTSMPVLMPALVPEPFDYAVPQGTPEGALVEAPLQGRKLIGVIWSSADAQGASRPRSAPPPAGSPSATRLEPSPKKKFTLKPVTRVLDTLPPLSKNYRAWIDWISDFTLAPKGSVLSLCGLAYAAKTPKKALPPQVFTITLPTLTDAQAAAAKEIHGTKPILLDGVTGSGKTEVYFHALAAAITAHHDDSRRVPSRAAAHASGGVGAMPPPNQVLVLLPEIALTHQWLARFEKTFGAKPVVWHSRMTPVAKARAWQAVARGEVQVVVGARSALFLPFKNLSLIIVDEEHDPSYKQEDGVLYHARDMAVVRAHFEQIPIVLASATPSLETLENVREGKYRALHLSDRFGAAGMPSVQLVDMRNDPPERGDFLSPTIKKELLATLARGEQALLFLNRRGYAPLLLCRACGHRFECKDCSAWLVLHGGQPPSPLRVRGGSAEGLRTDNHGGCSSRVAEGEPEGSAQRRGASPSKNYLRCHHCDHREPMPTKCPACSADAAMLAPCGPGVERIAEEVAAMLSISADAQGASRPRSAPPPAGSPSATRPEQPLEMIPSLAVLSSDESIATDTWDAIERGEIDIIVGTQMVAKGHHFPRLTFVAVVDADVGLSGADLRAGERTYQMLHQLGGRAGRGELAGRVFIQTYLPDHPVMEALVAGDRDQLMALEAKERRAGGWPPFGQLAAILLDGVDEAKVKRAGQILAQSAPADSRLTVLGPAPAPLSKLRGQFRYRLLVKARDGIHLQRTLKGWLATQKFSGVRIKVDVNPYYFL